VADLKNEIVDLQNKYYDIKKDLVEANREKSRSQTPQDDRDSRQGSEERSPQGEAMDIDELRDKFDDMRENLEKESCEVKDVEKQLEQLKKTKQEEGRYTVMVDDNGKVIEEKEEQYKQATLEVTKITAELVRMRQRCENYDRHNHELQQNLKEAKAPQNIYFCRHGDVYHGPNCSHTKDKQVNFLRKCKGFFAIDEGLSSAKQETDRSEFLHVQRNHSCGHV